MNTTVRLLSLVPIAAALVGCGTARQLTRDEALAATTRTYDVPKEQVIRATERVLVLADGDDVRFAHNPDGFTAVRNWSIYLVFTGAFGSDHWSVKVDEHDGRSTVRVGVGTAASTIAPIGGTVPIGTHPPHGPATYELFFSRLDYLLGYSPAWTDCAMSDANVEAKKTWGNTDTLCNAFNVKDHKPEGPLIGARMAGRL